MHRPALETAEILRAPSPPTERSGAIGAPLLPYRRPRLEAERLEELLRVAGEVFIEQGFDNASITEIAKRANASKGTFYSRFPTKEQLFLAVIEHRMRKIFEEVHLALPLNAPIQQTLSQFGANVLATSHSANQSALIRVIGMQADRFPELGRRFYELGPGRGQRTLAAYLAEHARKGNLRAVAPEVMADHFLSLLIGGTLLWFVLGLSSTMPTAMEQRQRVAAAVDVFLRAYATVGTEDSVPGDETKPA